MAQATATTAAATEHAMGHVAEHARNAEPDVAAVTTASSTATVTTPTPSEILVTQTQ